MRRYSDRLLFSFCPESFSMSFNHSSRQITSILKTSLLVFVLLNSSKAGAQEQIYPANQDPSAGIIPAPRPDFQDEYRNGYASSSNNSYMHTGHCTSCQRPACPGPSFCCPQPFVIPCNRMHGSCADPKCQIRENHVHVHISREQLMEAYGESEPFGDDIAQQPSSRPGGVYAAPPASGTTQSSSESFGIRGLALRLPELKLELPSIELPSLYRVRHGRKMRIDAADAPFVTDEVAARQSELARAQLYSAQPAMVSQMNMAYGAPQTANGYYLQTQRISRTRNSPQATSQSENIPSPNEPFDLSSEIDRHNEELLKKIEECEKLKADLIRQKQMLEENIRRLTPECTPLPPVQPTAHSGPSSQTTPVEVHIRHNLPNGDNSSRRFSNR